MSDITILCVDDDPTVLTALRAVLMGLSSGHQLELAQSGEEALEIVNELRQEKRDLAVVIVDFIMQGMHGDEFLVRLHAQCPDTIKIMLTGQTAFEGVKRAINQANLYRFLEKPFNNDDLLLTVKSACQAWNDHRALQRKHAELERSLAQLHEQREALAKSEARATISTLVASVSHELGTPIGNSTVTAEVLLEMSEKISADLESGKVKRSELEEFVLNVREGCQLLKKNLSRAGDLVSSFKQVAADQASEQRRRFDLAQAVHEILATMAPSLRFKPQKVVVEISPGIAMDSHPGALGQVVINLVNNAYMHAFEGKTDGVLTISAELLNDEQVSLCFVDNGIGMTPELQARILEPYFSTKIGQGGTGLGMPIVSNLVQKSLGGKFQISSQPGQGTRIEIVLPLSLPESAA